MGGFIQLHRHHVLQEWCLTYSLETHKLFWLLVFTWTASFVFSFNVSWISLGQWVYIYLQLLGVAQLCAVISWFSSTICRLVRDGADLPPAKVREAALWAITFLRTVCRQGLFAAVKQMALLCLHTAYYVCEESAMPGLGCVCRFTLCV